MPVIQLEDGSSKLEFTNRDFFDIKNNLIANITSKLGFEASDFLTSELGIAMLELYAYTGTLIDFYIDYIANESFLLTATERLSVIKHNFLIGYELFKPAGSSVEVSITPTTVIENPVTIPAGTTITSRNSGKFTLPNPVVISSSQQTQTLTFIQGDLKSFVFTSTGAPNFKKKLPGKPVIEGSVILFVNGIRWNEVKDPILNISGENILTYFVTYSDDYEAIIEFGDGITSAIPPANEKIEVLYRVGGGIDTNALEFEINTSFQVPTIAGPVSFSAVNELPGSGGRDGETIASAKVWGPKVLRTHRNAVTEEDYNTLGSIFSNPVFGSISLVRTELIENTYRRNLVRAYAWSLTKRRVLGIPSVGVRDSLKLYYDEINSPVVDIDVVPGGFKIINTRVQIKRDTRFNVSDIELINNVKNAIIEYFTSTELWFADFLRWSNIWSAAQNVAGVKYCNVLLPEDDIPIPASQVPILPTDDTGSPIVIVEMIP